MKAGLGKHFTASYSWKVQTIMLRCKAVVNGGVFSNASSHAVFHRLLKFQGSDMTLKYEQFSSRSNITSRVERCPVCFYAPELESYNLTGLRRNAQHAQISLELYEVDVSQFSASNAYGLPKG